METTSWNDIEKEIFSPKEIEDSKRRIAKIVPQMPLDIYKKQKLDREDIVVSSNKEE